MNQQRLFNRHTKALIPSVAREIVRVKPYMKNDRVRKKGTVLEQLDARSYNVVVHGRRIRRNRLDLKGSMEPPQSPTQPLPSACAQPTSANIPANAAESVRIPQTAPSNEIPPSPQRPLSAETQPPTAIQTPTAELKGKTAKPHNISAKGTVQSTESSIRMSRSGRKIRKPERFRDNI